VIKSGSEHKFTAGSELTFNPGFNVELGANFLAVVEGCDIIAKSYQNISTDKPDFENLDQFTLAIKEKNVSQLFTFDIDIPAKVEQQDIIVNVDNQDET
jgi:hypothetical protein